MEPAVLLLDEPLAALDLKLRKVMQEELRQLHRSIGGTFVFVTHDQGEAMGLADYIAVMRDGRIVQQGTPMEIYTKPATEFVAGFIGEANMFRGRRKSGVVEMEAGPTLKDSGKDGNVAVVVRPQNMKLLDSKTKIEVELRGRLIDCVYMGEHVSFKIELHTGQVVFVHEFADEMSEKFSIGTDIRVGWTSEDRRIVEAD
jgi:ABC-type Fe3+/spermidine/putrescine transport system ATPase subunit